MRIKLYKKIDFGYFFLLKRYIDKEVVLSFPELFSSFKNLEEKIQNEIYESSFGKNYIEVLKEKFFPLEEHLYRYGLSLQEKSFKGRNEILAIYPNFISNINNMYNLYAPNSARKKIKIDKKLLGKFEKVINEIIDERINFLDTLKDEGIIEVIKSKANPEITSNIILLPDVETWGDLLEKFPKVFYDYFDEPPQIITKEQAIQTLKEFL